MRIISCRTLAAFASIRSVLCSFNSQDIVPHRIEAVEPGLTHTSCVARTINYITHTLPQLCLTSAWSGSEIPTTDTIETLTPDATNRHVVGSESVDSPSLHREEPAVDGREQLDDTAGDPAPTPFMSFEDWKKMMLQKTGQDPQDLQHRQPNRDDRIPPDPGHAGLGEEDEISLNFDSYLEDYKESSTVIPVEDGTSNEVEQTVAYEDGDPSTHRSKDAGKTCKERFSYSSFDAGATILKTSTGAKNAKAILVENKDSYMLLECSAESKFVIVELSDDILIDTVVLANFEFFSSMMRLFRVSVSDRYPVKMERWRELGLFEARNSRDIQPFLVDNPQIWAKYVRIEFLTHYGNEYYCPVSLLRVHGSRMLDSWKDEAGRDDEPLIEHDTRQEIGDNPPLELDQERRSELMEDAEGTSTSEFTPSSSHCAVEPTWLHLSAPTCEVDATRTRSISVSHNNMHPASTTSIQLQDTNSEVGVDRPSPPSDRYQQPRASIQEDIASPAAVAQTEVSLSTPPTSNIDSVDAATYSTATNTVPSTQAGNASTITGGKSSSQSLTSGRNRTQTATAPAAASPTVQEGFFKAITKRLQQVESNLTLSLQYVEDQARHMQDTLRKTEQMQLAKASIFLDTLNRTVFAELRNIRGQYDEIWQSTVIALESQREQSEREIVALSTRLNLLADEVIFQKQMAIMQAVLLLSCLLLVIFSRGVSIPSFAPFMDQSDDPFRPARAFSRAHGLHGPKFDKTRGPRTLFDTHRPEYMPVAVAPEDMSFSDGYSLGDTLPPADSASVSHQQQYTLQHNPGSQPVLTDLDTSYSSHEPGLTKPRCLPIQQHSVVRKPLPALPEDPSSP